MKRCFISGLAESSGCSILTATRLPLRWVAAYTDAIPPIPSSESRCQRPFTVCPTRDLARLACSSSRDWSVSTSCILKWDTVPQGRTFCQRAPQKLRRFTKTKPQQSYRCGTEPEYSEGSCRHSVKGKGITLDTIINELKPGDVLGRYQLLMPIAKGGMGQVWAARQSGTRGFQKMVAVKTILPSLEDGQQLETMLFEEASLASLVRHSNVAETLDLGEREDGTLYLVMEWVDGEPLDQILRAARSIGGIPIAIAVHLITQACKGLHAAHVACNSKGEALGIVHRDISPQNLLVTYSGVVKLIDFGVAKATQQMSPPTATGEVKGKFAYMSPEQVHGDKLDARADVFAMGIVLYRVTTGTHPFKSDNPAATLRNILSSGPARPSELVPLYPKALEDVVMKALARDRNNRFESAHEMMLALEQALPQEVQANSEKNTEVFLRRLFAKRIAERNDALKSALLAADGLVAPSTD